ncbi:MAG: hypothetical protein ABW042_00565 [Phenylobacterium sp.]
MENVGHPSNDGSLHGRARIAVHIAAELIPLPLLEGLLVEGGDIRTFDPARQYCIRSFVPPKRTALSVMFEATNALIGVSWLQERNGPPFNRAGFAQSFTRLTGSTPWLTVRNMPERLLKRVGIGLDHPAYVRIHPPAPRTTRMFECVVEFNNGAAAPLSEISDFSGADERNARLILEPLSDWDRRYLEGISAFPDLVALFADEGLDLKPQRRAGPNLIRPVRRQVQDALPAPQPPAVAAPAGNIVRLSEAKP